MISEQNNALLHQLWPNYRDSENFIGVAYAHELAEAFDKAREEGRQEILKSTQHARGTG